MILNITTQELLNLAIIFGLNLITSTLSQLKYIIATKKTNWQMYLLIAVDSIFYLYSLTLVINKNSSLIGIIVLTAGRLLGVTVSSLIENNAIKNEYNYDFYFSDLEFVKQLEGFAHDNNISITRFTGYSSGIKRYIVNMHVNTNQEKLIFDYLKENGIENPTATCTEIKKVYGKLKHRL